VSFVGLGLRALKGGAAAVGVALERGEPRFVFSRFLATSAEGDRLSLEPYRVAAESKRHPLGGPSAEAVAAVAAGRRRQARLAVEASRAIIHELAEMGCTPVVAALLVNRTGWITDVLEYGLSWPEHIPVAEGRAVRDALRFAFAKCRVAVVELDEKSLPDSAAHSLRMTPAALAARLKALGATAGRPWRKEQKLAYLAAWVALTGAAKR
jgi:hypothetical protein